MMLRLLFVLTLLPLWLNGQTLHVPKIEKAIQIDGNLSEWKEQAFTDGLWDIFRIQQSPWYEPARNRLTDHGQEPPLSEDLNARYYLGWADSCLYFGAEVKDNVNDTEDPRHAPKRWYYKDAIAFFLEIPKDSLSETFGAGDHGFAFVIDSTYPDYGAWWRRGSPDSSFLESPLPSSAVDYQIHFSTSPSGQANYTLEARIDLHGLIAPSDPQAHLPRSGDLYGFMIVHCDPDGGAYGGHFLIYGQGDQDHTWATLQLVEERPPLLRKDH